MTLMMGLSIYDRQVRLCGIPDASVATVHDRTFFPRSSGCSGTPLRERRCTPSLSQRRGCVYLGFVTPPSCPHSLLCRAGCAKPQVVSGTASHCDRKVR